MIDGPTIHRQIHFTTGARRRKVVENGPAPAEPATPEGNIPRISRLMALALQYASLIDLGQITDRAELAQLTHISRARATHVMSLLHLAPSVREAILFLPRTTNGRDSIRLSHIRTLCATFDWGKQRKMWTSVQQEAASAAP